MLAPLAFIFKFMYQDWHTITLEEIETNYYDPTGKSNGKLSPEQFETVVGYAYPASSTETPTTSVVTTEAPTTAETTEAPTAEASTETPTTLEATTDTPTTVEVAPEDQTTVAPK